MLPTCAMLLAVIAVAQEPGAQPPAAPSTPANADTPPVAPAASPTPASPDGPVLPASSDPSMPRFREFRPADLRLDPRRDDPRMPTFSRRLTTIRDLRQVDPTIADVGPLNVSLRDMPPDLREPNDFRGVFQLPSDEPSRYAGYFARVRGGVWAVFPRSVYQRTEEGIIPTVPANTTFFLGGVPMDPMRMIDDSPPSRDALTLAVPAGSAESARLAPGIGGASDQPGRIGPVEGRVSTRIDTRHRGPDASWWRQTVDTTVSAATLSDNTAAAHRVSVDRLVHDEAYRAARLATLLRDAAQSSGPASPASLPPAFPPAFPPAEPGVVR